MNKQEIEKRLSTDEDRCKYCNSSTVSGGDIYCSAGYSHDMDCDGKDFKLDYKIEEVISACEKQLNNGWIPCSERMPTEEESKLYRGEFIIQTKEVDLPYVALWNRIKEVWQDDYKEIDEVIAWQPLPPRYEEVSHD